MDVELLRRWLKQKRTRYARVLRISEIPEENRGDLIRLNKAGKERTPPAHRCIAALPRANPRGRCYFVQCFKAAKHGSWCRIHAKGAKQHGGQKHRPPRPAPGEMAV